MKLDDQDADFIESGAEEIILRLIVLIEDDESVRGPTRQLFEKEGFRVMEAASLRQGNELLAHHPHLIVLDWNLPDGEGLTWLVRERNRGMNVPVIMLTARVDQVNKLMGLELGANDYMTKPFDGRELVARARNLLGRDFEAYALLREGGIELNLTTKKARYGDQAVDLTVKEFDLLKYLMERPGQVYTRDELHDVLWAGGKEGDSRAVDNIVLQLRKKLNPECIETVRGRGYRFKE